jgi:uncharacterized protein YodC (DUF2158 family)
MMSDFIRGDVVILKSGGPRMTVKAVYPNEAVECVWNDYGAIHAYQFPHDCLEKIEPAQVAVADGAEKRRKEGKT